MKKHNSVQRFFHRLNLAYNQFKFKGFVYIPSSSDGVLGVIPETYGSRGCCDRGGPLLSQVPIPDSAVAAPRHVGAVSSTAPRAPCTSTDWGRSHWDILTRKEKEEQ